MTETPKQDIDLTVDKKIFKGFDEDIQKKGETFVQEMKNAETKDKKGEIKEKTASFDRNGGIMLNLILTDINNNEKFEKIDPTNEKEPKIQTYIDAKKAFEEDMKKLNVSNPEITGLLAEIQNFIDKKQQLFEDQRDITQIEKEKTANNFSKGRILELQQSMELPKLSDTSKTEISKILEERLSAIEAENTVILNTILDKKPNENLAKELFENNQIARESLIAKKWENNNPDKTTQQTNFEELLKIYGGNREITSYKVGNYAKESTTYQGTKNININNYDYIQMNLAKTDNKVAETKDIMFGTNSDRIHTARAETYEGKRDEGESMENNLKILDNKGSYKEFKEILNSKGAEAPKFLNGLLENKLLEDIHSYKSKIDDSETKTNGYYGVILEYIVSTKNEGLLTNYLNKVLEDSVLHTEYLGTDWKNQVENFNKIVDKTKWNIDKNSKNGQLLETIRGQLAQTTNPKNFQETLSKGLDGLIDQFGPLLFSVLKMFGLGKGSLNKMFPGGKDKINEIYRKEFALSGDQLKSIESIVHSEKDSVFSSEDLTEKGTKRIQTGKDIESKFSKDKYKDIITDTDKGYYKSINVNVFQKGLDLYNKEGDKKPNEYKNINDIVTIKTDNATGKQSIVDIKKDETSTFTGAINSLLNNDSIRSSIAEANGEIQTQTEEKNIKTGFNQQGLEVSLNGEEKEASRYKIETEQDIARYLTAALFSNKDLSYVMTENQLHNRKEITTKDEVKEKEETTETPEQKIISERLNSINKEISSIDKENKYQGFDTNTYVYSDKQLDVQNSYQENILLPMQNLVEIQYNVKKINDKYLSEYPETNKWQDIGSENRYKLSLNDYAPHMKNMLIMMGGKEEIYKDITKNMIEGTTYSTGKNKGEIIMKNKAGITFGTLNFLYTENTEKTRTLVPKWETVQETGTIKLETKDNKIATERKAPAIVTKTSVTATTDTKVATDKETEPVGKETNLLETKLDEKKPLEFGENFPISQNQEQWQKYYETKVIQLNTSLDIYKDLINNELKDKNISDNFIQLIKEDILAQHNEVQSTSELSKDYKGDIKIFGYNDPQDGIDLYKSSKKKEYLSKAKESGIITNEEENKIIFDEMHNSIQTNNITTQK